MFINKHLEKPPIDTSKMSYINLFLKTELSCIPKLLKNYIGDYYNNAMFNGATWVFVLWCILHIAFDKIIDAFLKKLRYTEYVRLRLKNSLWYLGFYGTAVVYSGAALKQNEVELFNFKKMHVPSSSSLPSQVVIGYTLLSTFFLHSSLWEGLTKEYFLNMFSYLSLFLILVSSYVLRIVEISITFTALTGIAQVAVEFTRCCFMSSNQDSLISKLWVGMIYFTTYLICFAVYIIVIPLTFIVPLGLKLMSDYPNILLLFLFFNLVLFLIVEIYQSILFKFMDHWFYHQDENETENYLQCYMGLLECSLFKPRDDVSYNLQIIKREIKAREAKMMSLRKPKNKTMLIQTLKCMVAIKKKLSERRRSETSDSESDKSDNQADEDNGETLSDQDEDTDDESQDSVVENIDSTQVDQTKDCDVNDESDNQGSETQESDAETEKEKEGEDIDKLNLTNSKQSGNNNNKGEDIELNIDTSEHSKTTENAVIDKNLINDEIIKKNQDGDRTNIPDIKKDKDVNNKNRSSTLLLKGDIIIKDEINRNESDEDNTSASVKGDSPSNVPEEHKNERDVEEKTSVSTENEADASQTKK